MMREFWVHVYDHAYIVMTIGRFEDLKTAIGIACDERKYHGYNVVVGMLREPLHDARCHWNLVTE